MIRIALVALMLLGSISCGPNGPLSATLPHAGGVEGLLVHNYTSLPELANAADAIVIGTATASRGFDYGGFPFTAVTVSVSQTLKGAPPAQLTVLQTGGASGPAKDAPSGRAGPVSFSGVPVIATGETYLLFVYRYTGPLASDAYWTLGEFQGKFRVDGGRIGFAGQASSLNQRTFAVQKATVGRPIDEVVAEVRGYLGR